MGRGDAQSLDRMESTYVGAGSVWGAFSEVEMSRIGSASASALRLCPAHAPPSLPDGNPPHAGERRTVRGVGCACILPDMIATMANTLGRLSSAGSFTTLQIGVRSNLDIRCLSGAP